MANLISALPQQPSSNASPVQNAIDPKEAKLLQEKFAQNLDSAINSTAGDEQEQTENAAEMALLSGMAAQKSALPQIAQKIQSVDTTSPTQQQATALNKLQSFAESQKKLQKQNVQQGQQQNAQAVMSGATAAQAIKISPQEIMSAAKASNEFTPQVSESQNSQAPAVKPKAPEKLTPSEFQVNPLKKGQNVTDLAVLGAVQGTVVESAVSEKSNPKKIEQENGAKIGSHSSNLSTDSFLNLRELSQNKSAQVAPVLNSSIDAQAKIPVAEGMTAASVVGLKGRRDQKSDQKLDDRFDQLSAGIPQHAQQAPTFAKVMDAPVTQGSQLNHVLTHDTLHQISNHVANLNALKQDGEIKLRLKPDHLGELHLNIKASGQNVSVQIKAQDEQSKKIIEESLSSLKDNLRLQNLTLGSIEVITQPQNTQNSQMNMSQSDFASQMNFDQGTSQQSQSHSRQSEQNDYSSNARVYQEQHKPVNVAELSRARSAAQASAGRLDMIA